MQQYFRIMIVVFYESLFSLNDLEVFSACEWIAEPRQRRMIKGKKN